MANSKRNTTNNMTGLIVVAAVVGVSIFPWLIPLAAVGFVVYLIFKNVKKEQKNTKTPLSSAQKTEYQRQSPRNEKSQPAQRTPVYDASRFIRVTTDYGARHRENAKRMLDAGLIERDEYNMQIARSRRL